MALHIESMGNVSVSGNYEGYKISFLFLVRFSCPFGSKFMGYKVIERTTFEDEETLLGDLFFTFCYFSFGLL